MRWNLTLTSTISIMIFGVVAAGATELIKQYDQNTEVNPKILIKSGNTLSVIDYAELGVGVLPEDNSLAPINCIELPKDNEVSFGDSEGSLSLKFIKEKQELSKELNIGSTIKGNYGLLSGSLQASYLSSQQNKNNSLRLTFLSKTYRKVRLNTRVHLNSDGVLYRQTPALFAKRCGTNITRLSSFLKTLHKTHQPFYNIDPIASKQR